MNRMSHGCLYLLLGLGITLVSTPRRADAEEWIKAVATANLRERPEAAALVTGQLGAGEKALVLERRRGWVQIRRPDGVKGWTSQWLVRTTTRPKGENRSMREKPGASLAREREETDRGMGVRRKVPHERRLALVIGNDGYQAAPPLVNAVHDAKSMAAALESVGFEVESVLDADFKGMGMAIDRFTGKLQGGDVGFFYYAGHGFQVEGLNYLVPVDFKMTTTVAAKYDSYAADRVREAMEATGSRLNIIVLDACRNNPFSTSRANSGGLAGMNAGRGTYIAFATAPGRTAEDNAAAQNGLYTGFLIETIQIPGLSLDQVFNRVRQKVDGASGQAQTPWSTSSVIGDFYFLPPNGAVSSQGAARPYPPADSSNAQAVLPKARPPRRAPRPQNPTARPQRPAARRPGPPKSPKPLLALVPGDAWLLVAIDVAVVTKSKVYRDFIRISGGLPSSSFTDVWKVLGIDLETQVKDLLVGVGGDPPSRVTLVQLARGSFESAAVERLLTRRKFLRTETGSSVSVFRPTAGDAEVGVIALPDEHTIVLLKEARQQFVETVDGQAADARRSVAGKLLSHGRGEALVAGVFPPGIKAQFKSSNVISSLAKIDGFILEARLDTQIGLRLKILAEDPTAAVQVQTTLNGLSAMAQLSIQGKPALEAALGTALREAVPTVAGKAVLAECHLGSAAVAQLAILMLGAD